MEREACVCDHGLERSDLCAEIIILVIIIIIITCKIYRRRSFLLENNLFQMRNPAEYLQLLRYHVALDSRLGSNFSVERLGFLSMGII